MTLVPYPDREQGWVETLDSLDAGTTRVEQALSDEDADPLLLLASVAPGWVPPSHLGPLPDDLRLRAAQLLQRQLAVAEALAEQITKSKQQRDVAERMSQLPGRRAAAFIDQTL